MAVSDSPQIRTSGSFAAPPRLPAGWPDRFWRTSL